MLNDYKKRLDVLTSLHNNTNEFSHEVGSDLYCSYCDEYKELAKKYKESVNKIGKNPTKKNLFTVILSDESEYIIYANSENKIRTLLKKKGFLIERYTILPEKYWQTFYIENDKGILIRLSTIMENKNMRIVAKKERGNTFRQKGFVTLNQPISYLIHQKEKIEETEKFTFPCEVILTKKFKSNGKIAINTNEGNISVNDGQIILKLPKDKYVVYDEDDFNSYFFSEDNIVWKKFE